MTLQELDREQWLALRKNYIGASDAPVIMNGYHFNKTPYMLWEEKMGLSEGTKDNAVMAKGRLNEEPARQAYERYTGNLMFPEMVFHKERKYMMATLDGLSANGDMVVEIKCPGEADHQVAKKGRVPQKYWAQLQHQLACIGASELHYFSYRKGEGFLVEVERDEDYISSLYEKEEAFWKAVEHAKAPTLGEKDFRNFEQCEQWAALAPKCKYWQEVEKKAKAEKEKYRDQLIALSGGKSAQGHGIKMTRVVNKGRVDYGAIPELQNVDLDTYRKKSSVSWRISS